MKFRNPLFLAVFMLSTTWTSATAIVSSTATVESAEQRTIATPLVNSANENVTLTDSSIHAPSWRKTLFLAAGYGWPQGMRFELGYTIGESISLGFAFSDYNSWGYFHDVLNFGFFGSFHLPLTIAQTNPYIFISAGGSMSLFEGSDSYVLSYVGTMIELRHGLNLRPEIGLDFCNRHVSGGGGIFGSSPEITSHTTRVGLHLSIEVDVFRVF